MYQDLPPVKGHNVQMEHAAKPSVIPLRLVSSSAPPPTSHPSSEPHHAMSHRWGRWSLVVVAVAVAAGACVSAIGLESRLHANRQTLSVAATHAGLARAALGDVRRALAAMASPGQAAVGWSRRAVAGIEDLRRR